MIRRNQKVEQIIIITDEGENGTPKFVPTLQKYREKMAADPNVVFVKTPGSSDQMEREMKAAGLDYDVYQFNGDYYSLPNLIPMLAKGSKIELLMDIMDTPLPKRKAA
jgi:hypothetical protein